MSRKIQMANEWQVFSTRIQMASAKQIDRARGQYLDGLARLAGRIASHTMAAK